MSFRAGIIGFGKSGERFLKSIECVHELDVVGVGLKVTSEYWSYNICLGCF